MAHTLTLNLASEKESYYWEFETKDAVDYAYTDTVKAFEVKEPKNINEFMRKKRKEIEETGLNSTVQLVVGNDNSTYTLRPILQGERWYEGDVFREMLNYLKDKLGDPKLKISG